ncbi:MATE family efflux transporter [Merdimmobilis hominis]|uniref:MATE family efflux transporter n=1 Tax=Merdimmobilis hominis TaxID=2897707 RepID=UPI0008F80BE1|nr:MATE family efflux transporter [Merdimmobilis hominis]
MANQHDILGSKNPVRTVFLLSWPAILEQILFTAVQYVDTAMVGSLGANATAAVGINTSSIWLIGGLLNAVSTGFAVQVAQYTGAQDMDSARKVVRQAVRFCAFLGILLMGATMLIAPLIPRLMGGAPEILGDAGLYLRIFCMALPFQLFGMVFSAILRCTGDMKTPMVLNALSNLVNILFNTLFIFPTRTVALFGRTFTIWGAGIGVAGAAVGSVIAAIFVGVLMVLTLLHRKGPLQIRLRDCRQDDPFILRRMAGIGIPVFLERGIITMGQLIFTRVVTGLGTVALAAHTLANTAESLSYLPSGGFSYAATTLVGQSVGAKNASRARQYGKIATFMGMGMLTLTGLLLFFFPDKLVGIFSADAAVIALGALCLKIESLAQPLSAAGTIVAGALRGSGDSKWPFYIGFLGMWAVRIPLAFLLTYVFDMGLPGIWTAMCVDINVRGIISLHRFFRSDWAERAAA